MRIRHIFLRVSLGAVIVYLAAHAITGRFGLIAFVALQERENAYLVERDALVERIEEVRSRVSRLRAQSLDLDYLAERARVLVGAAGVDETVVLTAMTPVDEMQALP
jgi:cell division protein FtsB